MFSALNVFCLAIGISFCLLIGQYILHEGSVNADIKNVHQQYYLNSIWKIANTGPEMTTVGPLAKSLKENYPGLVANYYRFNPVVNVVSAGDKHFKEDVAIADTSLITMYGFQLLYGNPAHAFYNNRSVVITENLAMKLFGKKNVINKTIEFTNLSGNITEYKVSAVMKAMPYTTVTNMYSKDGYAMYIPFEGNQYYPGGSGEESWNGFNTVCFMQLQNGVKPEQLNGPMKRLLTLNSPESINKNLQIQLNPLDTFYLTSNHAVIAKTLSILSVVALGILLLAVINFINIMIGTSAYRIKEIGLRKVFGGRRRQLVMQYLIESVLLSLLAAILSVLLYGTFRPLFNDVLNTALQPVNGFGLREVYLLGLLVLIVGILAGIYPALILSGSEIISSVKGKLGSIEKGKLIRKSLLVLQFTIAIGVFIFSMTLSRQIKYFFDKDLGYDKDRLMVITAFPKQWDSAGVVRIESIRDGLLRSRVIKDATVSFDIPEKTPPGQQGVNPEGNYNGLPVSIQTITVDERYASTFGISITEGRFFRDQISGIYTGEAVINESAMKIFGWSSAVGKKIKLPDGGGDLTVVGVIKDFHLASLHELIKPLLLFNVKDGNPYRFMTVKLQAGNLSKSIEMVRAKWKELSPSAPFDFVFMDDKLQSMYQLEMQLKKAASIASGLMLLIVLLGIFGVLTLALTRRIKEIAVRKVLGAELHNIVSLIIKEFAGLIFIANLIAWPLAYYFTNQWLRQFAYRIIPSISIYLIAGCFVTIIAFALISVQSLKVAMTNPVKSLKAE